MEYVKDLKWEKGLTVNSFVERMGKVGFQSVELARAGKAIANMKRDGARVFLTFTSNMMTSGLRGFFAQLVEIGIPKVIVTTVGGIEEDIMKAVGEKFLIGQFFSDDVALHERGLNRVGNLHVDTQSYMKFEDVIEPMFKKIYEKKQRITPSELFREIGLMLEDNDSVLYQAAKKDVPVFCPAITDGAFGFHLYMFQQKHKDFIIDVVKDFERIMLCSNYDERKGLIALGGSISKHHAILATLLNGGLDYAVYMTTATQKSGSMSGATTQEAKSWGKIKDDSDAATVIGDVTIMFPLAMMRALEMLEEEGILFDDEMKKSKNTIEKVRKKTKIIKD